LVNNDGKLGIEIGRLSFLPWKIRLLQSKQTKFGFLESIPVGLQRKKPSSRIRKTTKMIFSPSTGAYKQVGG
jgi:regulator of sigma E protease